MPPPARMSGTMPALKRAVGRTGPCQQIRRKQVTPTGFLICFCKKNPPKKHGNMKFSPPFDAKMDGGTVSIGKFGVCVEYMIELANQLGADPWFSMPKADVFFFFFFFFRKSRRRMFTAQTFNHTRWLTNSLVVYS